MKVIPPNFGYVEEGIFRCGAPEPRHYGFLASLGLRTCILLTDTHDGAFVHWLQETGVMIFCPLSSEGTTRGGSIRGGVSAAAMQSYNPMGMPDKNISNANHNANMGGMGYASSRASGGARDGAISLGAQSTSGPNNLNASAARDDGREDAASPGSGFGDAFSPGSGSGRFGTTDSLYNNTNANAYNDGAEGENGGEGGFDGSGNYNVDDGYGNSKANNNTNSNYPAAAVSGLSASRGGGGWSANGATSGGHNTNTNGGTLAGTSNAVRFLQENVVDRQFSTKFSPVLVQEPVYFPGDVRGGGGGAAPYQFVSAPSYEGRLHGLMTLSEAVVVSLLHIMLDPRYYPLLITCSKGRYRSGIVCGCLRKLQGWNLVSILEEYRRFAGNKSRADNEEFIELFDEELVNLELPDGRRPTILYNT